MTLLRQELTFDKERLTLFFNRQTKRFLKVLRKSYQKFLLFGLGFSVLSIALFMSMTAKNHLVSWNFLTGIAGIIYTIIGISKFFRYKKLKQNSFKAIATYFENNQHLKVARYEIDEDKLDYLENGEFKDSFKWSALSEIVSDEEYFTLIYGDQKRNVFFPKSEVDPTFFKSLLELAKRQQIYQQDTCVE